MYFIRLEDADPVFCTRIVYFLSILKQWILLHQTRKTDKYSYPCMLKYNRKNDFVEKVLRDTFSCLGGQEVTHQTGMREIPGSIPGSVK